MKKLEARLGYRFRNTGLLEHALTHSSYANEHRASGATSNERLEFLGDSILGLIVAEYLFRTHPDMPEGELTRTRAALVCEDSLYEVARTLELGGYLRLGKGEAAGGGRTRPSILADATEAMLAAVYLDGALRFVTDEGDHLREFLYAVRAPWQTDGVQTDFVHALRLVDGIYPAAAITPYRDLTAALRADDLLQVKAVRYETVTRELPFETQTIEDAGLDFGKTETVQAGQNGSELVTSEITTVAGEVVSTRVVDVQLVQASVPEVIHRGTRLKSGMIGRLGTGSFLWPVPGYSGISRWASLPYGHRGVDITAPYGTPIYAADAGTVIAAQWHNHPTMSWGYYVEIDHGNGYKTLYAHMSSFVVQAGQTVEKGQLIGYVGATGAATGPHCHFEMYYNNALISARNVFPDM